MFYVKSYKLPMLGILLCLIVIALCDVVTAQEALPYQLTWPYQNAFNHDRRRLNAPYSGFSAALSSGNGDLIRFPDESMSPVSLVRSLNDENDFNERHKKDNKPHNNGDEIHQQKPKEVSGLTQLVTFHFHKRWK